MTTPSALALSIAMAVAVAIANMIVLAMLTVLDVASRWGLIRLGLQVPSSFSCSFS